MKARTRSARACSRPSHTWRRSISNSGAVNRRRRVFAVRRTLRLQLGRASCFAARPRRLRVPRRLRRTLPSLANHPRSAGGRRKCGRADRLGEVARRPAERGCRARSSIPFAAARGVIGIYDSANGFARLGEIPASCGRDAWTTTWRRGRPGSERRAGACRGLRGHRSRRSSCEAECYVITSRSCPARRDLEMTKPSAPASSRRAARSRSRA